MRSSFSRVCQLAFRQSLMVGVPKESLSTKASPPVSSMVSRPSITSSRRSSRAIPRKNYGQDEMMNDPDVFENPLAREASPDQHSETSGPLSEFDLTEPPSEVESDAMSDDSFVQEKVPPSKKNVPSKRVVAKTPQSRKTSTNVSPTNSSTKSSVNAGSSKKATPVKAENPEEEPYGQENQEAEDLEEEEKKGPTKASKHRERDARAAERYADFAERPPTFDSDYVPVPFKGRLGYACLNTILRSRKEPVFCSRTTRIATIAKEDKGMPFVLELGKQNAADLSKMIEWNEKYGIRFFRLSSEMFPFASHPDYLYNLEHADAELRAAGALANKYDHRITCHPGQFTQIASPTAKIFDNAVRDLEFHNELLTRMRLEPEQRDRDAVLILHLGGAYGDKPATLDRFRTNYARLSEPVKRRLVLENDDMSWSVTDLLPLCQELNIPLVLDWHHHNIVHDEEKFREGSLDLLPLLPAIAETWTRKGIKQKMHISEARLPNHPLPSQRRSHSARVYHLPPCADDMDIMIEAKDKEQAVFELAKTYNLNNPPLPAEVVGDGPGAKGDEAYWPEGQELRLKTTKTRVKKEPEYDSEGNEVKPEPKKRVKKEPEYDSEGNEIKSVPKKRAKKEPQYDSEGNEVVPESKKRIKKEPKTIANPESQGQIEEDAKSAQVQATAKKPAARKRGAKKSSEVKTEELSDDSAMPAVKIEGTDPSIAAPEVELQTGISAKNLVDKAYENIQANEQSQAGRLTRQRSKRN